MTKLELLTSEKFAYARYKRHYEDWAKAEWGDGYYRIYHKDSDSPTGVVAVGSMTIAEWEELSKVSKNSHNYLSPTEKY